VKTYVATNNPGKLRELKAIFARSPLQIVTPRKRIAIDVVENAPTYAGNALIKAQALAAELRSRHIGAAVLADDSGLEVDALDGRPGIHSARYGGPEMEWPQRRAALLAELRGVPPYRRAARFVCTLCLIRPHGEPVFASGEVSGYVLEAGERRLRLRLDLPPSAVWAQFRRADREGEERRQPSAPRRRGAHRDAAARR